jgi:hypothetical protein
MTGYQNYGVNLSKGQAKKIFSAHKNGRSVTIKLSKLNLQGEHKLPLRQTQINKIKKAKGGVQLKLSESQLKHVDFKTGGFIPLLSLIPIIASALGAAGGVAGTVASAVSASKSNAEQVRHNKAIEEQLKSGSGVISDFVENVPVLGRILGPLMKKIGLGVNDINTLNHGGCVCSKGLKMRCDGRGLYLEPEGSGLFLGPKR